MANDDRTGVMLLGVLPDPALLEMGRITVLHARLDYILRLTIKTITGVSHQDAIHATHRDGSADLRRQIRDVAKKKIGNSAPLIQLRALLRRCEIATEKRNALTHSMMVAMEDSGEHFMTDGHKSEPVPSGSELEALSAEIASLAVEMNDARRKGFLREALDAAAKRSNTNTADVLATFERPDATRSVPP